MASTRDEWSNEHVRARLEALEAELAGFPEHSGRFQKPPPMPAITYWYVRDGARVFGPIAEPEVLEAMGRSHFGPRCAVARVGQDHWLEATDVPMFRALLDPMASDEPSSTPEMPIPGLEQVRFPAWARLVAISAATISGAGLLTPLGAFAAHDHVAPAIAGALTVWRLVTFALVASAATFAPAKMLTRCILAAGSFLLAGWVTRIVSHPASGLFAVDILVAFALGLAALGFAEAFETHAGRVHRQALDFAAALEPPRPAWRSRLGWAMLAIVLTGVVVVGVGVGLWLMLA
ncbi:MAG: hypothetical protein GXP55_25750 [Deltaproteobacteria bacterium]|nr:hypothetical protein [Deltaproteobacteria bacterium]